MLLLPLFLDGDAKAGLEGVGRGRSRCLSSLAVPPPLPTTPHFPLRFPTMFDLGVLEARLVVGVVVGVVLVPLVADRGGENDEDGSGIPPVIEVWRSSN